MTGSPSPEVVLTDAQVREYAERGFLVLDRITTEAEVAGLRDVYDRLFAPDAVVADHDRLELADGAARTLPQVLNPDHYAPELRATVAYRNASAIARQLLGERSERMGMHAIRKPARSGAETPWHQDEAYWDPAYQHRALSIWIPLQPATLDNGCLHFVPGSHRGEVREHQLIDPDSASGLRLAERVPNGERVPGGVPCPVPAGGATIHDGRTLHYAGANRTDEPRRALVMAFRTPPVWQGTRSFSWQPAAR